MRALRAAVVVVLATIPHLGCPFLGGSGAPRARGIRQRVERASFTEIKLVFDVEVENPCDAAVAAPRYALDLSIRGRTFHRESGTAPRGLPARGRTTLKLPCTVPYKHVWRKAPWLEDQSAVPYRLRGTLRFAADGRERTARLSHKGSFPHVQAPQFTDFQPHIPDKVTPQMKLQLYTRLTNPNVFEIDMRGLAYEIEIGGDSVGRITTSSDPVIGPGKSEWVLLTAQVSALKIMMKYAKGPKALKGIRASVTGWVKTPYGNIRLGKRRR